MARIEKKIFVLDTNVILHDSSCIYKFAEHDIVIPITVLEELDNFKKGNESLHFHAREFGRALDSLSGDKLFNGGVTIGPSQGKISIKLEMEFHPDLSFNFAPSKADHNILNIAYRLKLEFTRRQIILVSKDVNLRMKAKAVGLFAQDYKNDHIENIEGLYKGRRIEENINEEFVQKMYDESGSVPVENMLKKQTFLPNEYVILRHAKKSALAYYQATTKSLCRVDKIPAYGIVPRNSEQTFALHALLNPHVQLVTINGKAGTGKTLLALAAALEQKKNFRQIFLARPVVPLSNKDIGYLPGDIHSKLDPYMQPLYDNLGVIQNQFSESNKHHLHIRELLDQEKLVLSPLAFIRGRSLVKIFFIVDEAQNLTPHEVKTIITRAGEGTKMVFAGDINQIDHPYLDSHSNGLTYLIDRMKGQNLYAHMTLEKGERSELSELASDLL
jgi:PhoH-like ATPase